MNLTDVHLETRECREDLRQQRKKRERGEIKIITKADSV